MQAPKRHRGAQHDAVPCTDCFLDSADASKSFLGGGEAHLPRNVQVPIIYFHPFTIVVAELTEVWLFWHGACKTIDTVNNMVLSVPCVCPSCETACPVNTGHTPLSSRHCRDARPIIKYYGMRHDEYTPPSLPPSLSSNAS